ncbi:MAG: AAA domain-containing protein [Archangium sp.]
MKREVEHFDRLGQLLDLERRAQRERIADERRTLPLAELEARGLVVLDVETTEENVGLGGRHLVTFMHESKKRLSTRLGPGDLISVSPRKAEVDAPPQGTVVNASRSSVVVAFDRPPPPWMGEGRLRLDVTVNDVTFDRGRAALTRWKEMDSGIKRDRREVLLGNTPPRFEKLVPLDKPSRTLNPEQLDAVSLVLAARDFALIHGPPGTGKSTVLAEVAVQWARQGKRILCTAASNAAVDHLLELCLDAGLDAIRVGHPARVLPHLQQHTLDLLVEEHADRKLARSMFEEAFDLLGYARKQRERGRSRERFSNAREAQAEARKLMDEARVLERKAVSSILGGARVVCATLTMLEGHVLSAQSFDAALLDEATQAIEPQALMAFHKAPIVALAGDPKQLAPTVISLDAEKKGLGVSLFERLLADWGDDVKRMLKEQHRMHETIMRFPSDATYGGQLRAHPSVAQRTLDLADVDAPPVLFLDTAGKGFDESRDEQSESARNEGEADLIVARARELLARGLSPKELAVITPYRAQAAWLRDKLQDVADLEIDTVDAFQGREKDVILVTLVRSNTEQQLGFLEDLRRLNVAITRPRKHLFVVGDSATLSGHPHYAKWIEFVQSVNGYRSAWEWQPGNI